LWIKKKTEKEYNKKLSEYNKKLSELTTKRKNVSDRIKELRKKHYNLSKVLEDIFKERERVDELWKKFYTLITDYKLNNSVSHAVYELDYEYYRNEIVSIIIQLNDRLADLQDRIK